MKDKIIKEIDELNVQIDAKRKILNEIFKIENEQVEIRINLAVMGNGDFSPNELIYAATATCNCGAGMAYPDKISIQGSWYCSKILRGLAEKGSTHSPSLPFALYEVKSEEQPSAKGKTTRNV